MKLLCNPPCSCCAATQCHYDCYNFKGSVADGQMLKSNAVAACKVRAEHTKNWLWCSATSLENSMQERV